MSLVLAIEPDASQADPLTSIVRGKLGAQLQLVTSTQAAIVAMNQRTPDLVLLGRELPQEERTKAVTHLRSVTPEGSQARTLDVPKLSGAPAVDAFQKKVGVALAACEEARVRAMASVFGRPTDAWDAVAMEEQDHDTEVKVSLLPDREPGRDEADVVAADLAFIEAEVEFRLKSEVERIQAEAARQQAAELAKVEAEVAARQAKEVERIEAMAAAEVSAREALAAELERMRREAAEQLAAEVQRVRQEAEQGVAAKLAAAQADADRDREERIARARAEAEAAKMAAIEEARRVVEAAAARAKMAEDEVERVKHEADAKLKAAVEKARAESEAQLQAQVARAQAETEARLEAQLASVIGQAEQFRHENREMVADADKIRMEAAQAARDAAERALATEVARIRAEAAEHLEAEIGRLRAEAAERALAEPARPLFALGIEAKSEASAKEIAIAALKGIRWDFVATAAIVSLVVVSGILYLPAAVRTAAHTSSTVVTTAGKAAKAAAKKTAAVAPVVANRALTAAERALPGGSVAKAEAEQMPAEPTPEEVDAAVAAVESGPGFLKAFSRIPMDIYVDGTRMGSTEDGRNVLLPSGSHRLEFVSERFHYRSSITVKIEPGHIHPYTVALPTAAVHVTTTPGAEVFVEGARVGVAPLAAIQVPIGTREISSRDATGERREVIEVKYGQTTEVSLAAATMTGDAAPARLAPLAR